MDRPFIIMNPDVIDIQPLKNYILRLIFEGGEVRDFDVKPYLDVGFFPSFGKQPILGRPYLGFGSVEWPNGQGLSYDTLYEESVSAKIEV